MWESGLPDFRVGGPAGSRWNPGVQKGSHEQDLALGKSRVQACEGGDFLHPLPSALPSFPMVGTRGCVSVRQHSAAELRHCVPSAELRLALNSWFFCFLLFSTGLPDCHPSHHDQSHCAYRAVPPPPQRETHTYLAMRTRKLFLGTGSLIQTDPTCFSLNLQTQTDPHPITQDAVLFS